MCRSRIILTLFAAALLGQQLFAANYHVASGAAGASDSNNGLSASVSGQNGPWKTIRHAIDAARAGDVVYVYSGDYRSEGTLQISRGGSSGSPIQFRAASGNRPTVQGFAIKGTSWIVVEGFVVQNRNFTLPSTWRDMPATVVDNPSIQIDPDESWSSRLSKVRTKYATYMRMVDQWENSWSIGIDVAASTDVVIRGNEISYFTLGIQPRERSARIRVEGNRVHHNRTGLFTWRANPSLSDSDIIGNRFYQNLMDGVDVREEAADVRIVDNDFEYQGTAHISVKSGSHHTLVKGNKAYYGGYYTETMENPGSSAINYHTAGVGNVADGNIAAYHVDPTQLDGNGFILDLMGATGVTLQNNVAYRNSGSGITTTRTGYSKFVHNSLIENGYGSTHAQNGAGIRFAKPEDRGHIIANNIFVRNRTAGIWTSQLIGEAAVVDGNLYDQSNSALIWDSGSKSSRYYTSIQAVRSGTGREASGLEANPGFVSSSEFVFRLGSTSPARSAALAAYSPVTDFEGDVRDSSPDIGHDEVSALDSTPPTINFVQPNGSGTAVEVDFSEAVSAASAASAGSYALDGEAQVVSATMLGAARVRLETKNLVTGKTYLLSPKGVRDLSGNPFAANYSFKFDYIAADEMVFQATSSSADDADAELSGAQPAQNFGNQPTIQLRTGSSGSVGLLSWDLAKIPAGAQVVSAEIEVQVTEGTAGRVETFGLLRNWEEAATNWTKASAAESWGTAGAAGAGDRAASPAGLGVIVGTGPLKIRLNQAGVSLLQAWVDGSSPNHGLLAVLGGASGATRFVSSEGTTATQRPKLTVRYQSTENPAPAQPSDLHLVEATTTSIKLAWDFDSENPAQFRIYRNGVAIGTSSTPSFTATGLVANTAYTFHVTALASDGSESASSNVLSARTQSAVLGAPSNLRLVSAATNSISLAWNAPTGSAVSSYRVYRNGAATGTSSTPSYTATGLAANTAYSFHVTAVGSDGRESASSNVLSARTQSAALGAPSNLRAVSTATNNVVLAWNAPTGSAPVSSYRVYRNGVATGSSSSPSYTATGLAADTAYNFHVTAVASDGLESAPSNVLSARTQAAATLGTPSNLRIISSGTTNVTLAWNAPAGGAPVSSYRVYRNGAATGVTTATQLRVDGLTPGTRYSFVVKAVGASGSESAESNTVTTTTRALAAASRPVVKSIRVRTWKSGRRIAGRAEVVLTDASGESPVSGATLTGQWTINDVPYGPAVSMNTGRSGAARHSVVLPSKTKGVVRFVVTAVKSTGYSGPIGPYTGTSSIR